MACNARRVACRECFGGPPIDMRKRRIRICWCTRLVLSPADTRMIHNDDGLSTQSGLRAVSGRNLRSTPTASRSMCLARRQAGQLLCDPAHVSSREIEVVGSRDFRVHGVQSWLRQTIALREKLDGTVVLALG